MDPEKRIRRPQKFKVSQVRLTFAAPPLPAKSGGSSIFAVNLNSAYHPITDKKQFCTTNRAIKFRGALKNQVSWNNFQRHYDIMRFLDPGTSAAQDNGDLLCRRIRVKTVETL
jgi:hypothetical protein